MGATAQRDFGVRVWLLFVVSLLNPRATGATIYRHSWDTVGDVMGMHGKFSSPDSQPSAASIKFAADHYGMVTTGGSCPKTSPVTLEGNLFMLRSPL
jgi:hypothetical protein